MPVIGYLYEGWPEPTAQLLAAFRKGLSETGYVSADTGDIAAWPVETGDEASSFRVPAGTKDDRRQLRRVYSFSSPSLGWTYYCCWTPVEFAQRQAAAQALRRDRNPGSVQSPMQPRSNVRSSRSMILSAGRRRCVEEDAPCPSSSAQDGG
jgi:hypothetical protein